MSPSDPSPIPPTDRASTAPTDRSSTPPTDRASTAPTDRTPSPPTDPVRARRATIAKWTLIANRVGYLFIALAMALFFMAFVFDFNATMATLIIVAFVFGCTLLAPSIILGYAVKAAERDDVEHGR